MISDTMKRAIAFAKENGGKLVRHPGGFWAGEAYQQHGKSFGTSTIHALVTRGLADYTSHKDGRHGRFPIEITLKAGA